MIERLDELVSEAHKSNSRHMLPVTLIGVALILIYAIFSLQGLIGPDGRFIWEALLKIVILTALIGGTNVIIFEMWTRRRLRKAMRVVLDEQRTLPPEEAKQSLLELIKFPWSFSIHFMAIWIVVIPIIIFSIRFFYGITWFKLFNLSIGTIVIFALMSLFHYFTIKRVYDPYLQRGLRNFPQFVHLHEFETHQVSYRKKVFVFLVILVASMVWVSTRFNALYQARQAERMRGQFITDMLL
jgi:hypothetical protein